MKKYIFVSLFSIPFLILAQNPPVKQDTVQHKTRGGANPFVNRNTKNYVPDEYIILQKRASMMDLGGNQARGTLAPLNAMDVNIMTSGMDTIEMTGTKTSIFNAKK